MDIIIIVLLIVVIIGLAAVLYSLLLYEWQDRQARRIGRYRCRIRKVKERKII